MNENDLFQEYLDRLKDLYQRAIWSYYCWEGLQEILAPNIVGEEAHKNLNIWNQFNRFFMVVQESSRVFFFLELAKIFDTQKDAIRLAKLINFTKSNHHKIKKVSEAEGLKKDDFLEIEKLLDKNSNLIEKIKNYRDQHICHDDIGKEKIIITGIEVEELMNLVGTILNLLTLKISSSTTGFDFEKESFKEDIKTLFDDLKKFQKYKYREHWEKALVGMPEEQKKEIMNMQIVREQCEL